MTQPTPRGLRNCNPGNIRLSATKYQGEIQPSRDPAFKQFESMAYGYRAIFMLLHTYAARHGLDTIRGMISRYAPTNENDTAKYIRAVSDWSFTAPDTHLTTTNAEVMIPIVSAISRYENGRTAVTSDVQEGWRMFIRTIR